MEKEMMEWLERRAHEEMANILSKKVSMLKYLFTSKDKLEKNKEEAAKSLGRLEMIKEILQKHVDTINKNEGHE